MNSSDTPVQRLPFCVHDEARTCKVFSPAILSIKFVFFKEIRYKFLRPFRHQNAIAEVDRKGEEYVGKYLVEIGNTKGFSSIHNRIAGFPSNRASNVCSKQKQKRSLIRLNQESAGLFTKQTSGDLFPLLPGFVTSRSRRAKTSFLLFLRLFLFLRYFAGQGQEYS